MDNVVGQLECITLWSGWPKTFELEFYLVTNCQQQPFWGRDHILFPFNKTHSAPRSEVHGLSKLLWRIWLVRAAVNTRLGTTQTTSLKWDSWSQSISTVLLLWYQSLTGKSVYRGRLTVRQTDRNAGSESRPKPPDHSRVWNLHKKPVDAPHLRLCCLKSLSFTITLLCHRGKCWKWHVTSTVRLITLVRRTGRTWGLHHSTSNFLFKIANSTEATARLKTHFTLCLNQSTLPEPDIDRDPLTCCTFTYWSPHLHALSALMTNCGLRLILTLNESKWVINNIRTLPEASKLEGEKSFQRWHGLNFTWGSNSPVELLLLIIPPKKYNVEYNVPLPWKMCFLLVPPVDCLGLTL